MVPERVIQCPAEVSAGRQVALGPMIKKEIEGLKNIWNVPMIGFFSNAELGRAIGGNLEMHNLTN